MLSAGRPEEIVNWCRYILTQPVERAVDLSKPLHPVMGKLTPEGTVAVRQVLRSAMFGERPEPR